MKPLRQTLLAEKVSLWFLAGVGDRAMAKNRAMISKDSQEMWKILSTNEESLGRQKSGTLPAPVLLLNGL